MHGLSGLCKSDHAPGFDAAPLPLTVVEAPITDTTIENLHAGRRVAVHPRSPLKRRRTTRPGAQAQRTSPLRGAWTLFFATNYQIVRSALSGCLYALM
jgi:hypothetical protein